MKQLSNNILVIAFFKKDCKDLQRSSMFSKVTISDFMTLTD